MNLDSVKVPGRPVGLSYTLGMEFVSTPDENECVCTMPVDDRNIQPWGVLNGGAALSLAETTAGLGSIALCPGHIVSGICIDGHHVHPAAKGDIVTATARILHKGRHTHVWNVEIKNRKGELISYATVTNYISAPPAGQ